MAEGEGVGEKFFLVLKYAWKKRKLLIREKLDSSYEMTTPTVEINTRQQPARNTYSKYILGTQSMFFPVSPHLLESQMS